MVSDAYSDTVQLNCKSISDPYKRTAIRNPAAALLKF